MSDYTQAANYMLLAVDVDDAWMKDRALRRGAKEITTLRQQLAKSEARVAEVESHGDAEPFERIDRLFVSGNSIPVERVVITREMWDGVKAWQATRTQGDAEAIGVIAHTSDPRGDNPKAFVKWLFDGDETNFPNGTELYTQPQPASPEGWKDCLEEMVEAMRIYQMDCDEEPPYKHKAMMSKARALLDSASEPPKQEGA